MRQQVEQRQNGSPGVSVAGQRSYTGVAQYALEQIEERAEAFAPCHDERALARCSILFAVAVVVQNQQRVGHQSAGSSQPPHCGTELSGLYIIRAAYGNEAEEGPHQHVAAAVVGQQGRIEKGEDHAGQSQHHQRPSAVREQTQADAAGGQQHAGYAGLHGAGRYPALGTGTFRAQTVSAVTAPGKVEQVVDEVGRHLHQGSKQGAEQGRLPLAAAFGIGQRGSGGHGDKGSCQRLRTCGQQPVSEGSLSHLFQGAIWVRSQAASSAIRGLSNSRSGSP